jgi:hypothetical protein
MRNQLKLAIAVGMLALSALPAMAFASNGNGPNYAPENTPQGPKGQLPSHAKAYGVYCRGESKKHVKGVKGTPFSQCVHSMKVAARNDDMSARQACKQMSKKHVKGEKRTPFANCIVGVAHLRRDEKRKEREEASSSSASTNGTSHKHVPAQANTPDVPTPAGPQYEPAGEPPHGHAYGYVCKGKSKKHVKGEKGTEFSRCVHAMRELATGEAQNPRQACHGLSKKHVKGEKGTEFSRCVVAAAKLRHEERTQGGEEGTSGS